MKAQIEENLKIELEKYFSELDSLIDSVEKITISPNKKRKQAHLHSFKGNL
jgi:hypothetical protein